MPETSAMLNPPQDERAPTQPRMRAVDVVLIVALVSALVPWGLAWDAQPSWPRDLMTLFVLVAMAIIGGFLRSGTGLQRGLALGFAAMSLLGTITWIATVGSDIGLNFWAGWSPWVLSTAFLLYAFTYGPRRWAIWRKVLIWFGIAVAVVQDLGILGKTVGLLGSEASRHGDFYGMRTIHASLALLILAAFVLLVTSTGPLARRDVALSVFLGLSVVISQHRSVWVALAIVTALLVVRATRVPVDRGYWVSALLPMVYLVVANLAPLVGLHLLPRVAASVSEKGVADAVTSSNSLEWRLEMWRTRLRASRDLMDWMFGGVFGVTPVKWPGNGVMNPHNSGHNMLIDVSVMLGIVGVLVVVAIFVAATLRREDRLDPLAIFIWGLLGYGIFYYWPAWSWIIIGTALASPPRPRADVVP